MKKIFSLLFLIPILTSCHYFGKKESRIRGKGLLLTFAEPNYTLDWHKETNLPSLVIITNLMEGLVDYDADSIPPKEVPALAESWEGKNGNTEWIFKIRPLTKWSDGVELTSQHFINTFKRLLDPITKSPYADVLFEIKNAKAFNEGTVNNFDEVGIKAPDASTLVFTLSYANPKFAEVFTHFSTYPMRQENIDLFSGHGGKVESIPWIGGFKTTYISRKRILLAENRKYRTKHAGIKKVEVLLDISKERSLKMLKEKKSDIAFDVETGLSQKNLITIAAPGFETVQLTFNCQVRPFTNPVMRRVIGLSLNKEELAHVLTHTEPLGGVIPPGVKGYESNRGLSFDPDMATQVMKNANLGAELKKYQYDFFVEDPTLVPLAQNIKDQLAKFIGLNIKIVESKFDGKTKTPSMILERVKGRNLNPSFYLSQFDKKSEKNISGWKNPTFEEFLRKQILSQAQHILVEKEIPVVPLLAVSHNVTAQSELHGLKQSFFRIVDFKELTMERQ